MNATLVDSELIKVIQESAEKPFLQEIDGKWYTDSELTRLPEKDLQPPLRVHTLQAVVDYLLGFDKEALGSNAAVLIEGPTKVSVIRSLKDPSEDRRWTALEATASSPTINILRTSVNLVDVALELQCGFVPSDARAALLKSLSSVVASESLEISDDGSSFKVIQKSGIEQLEATIPNPHLLQPFRTFSEVTQPESPFVLRLKKNGDNAMFASLTCSDGGAWEQEACTSIKNWLSDKLKDAGIPVLG